MILVQNSFKFLFLTRSYQTMSTEDLQFESVFPSSAYPSSPSASSTANFALPTPPNRRKEQRISVSSDDDDFDFNDRCCFGSLNILVSFRGICSSVFVIFFCNFHKLGILQFLMEIFQIYFWFFVIFWNFYGATRKFYYIFILYLAHLYANLPSFDLLDSPATLGVAQLLAGSALYIPQPWAHCHVRIRLVIHDIIALLMRSDQWNSGGEEVDDPLHNGLCGE